MDIVKVFENNMDLLVVNTKENEKDWEFLNGLWQYVLISKNISRTLPDRKSTRLNSSHTDSSRMPSSA